MPTSKTDPPPRRGPWPDVPESRRAIMRSNRRRDTAPELAMRSALHRAGLRFRVDMPVRPAGHRVVRPDVVFPRRRLAIYVDGCFWHGCPIHGTQARTNAGYWRAKIAENQERDRRITAALEDDGWIVLRFWEHEEPAEMAARVAAALRLPLAHPPIA
ncbi:MAG: very short patch repair endonuclease [Solirubrobacteraceae bacterium]